MALQLPAGIPNFNVQQPPPFDPLAQRQKQATLSGMLDENALRRQLAPLNVQEAQAKAEKEIREKTLKQVANKLGDIGDMNISKAANALDAFRQDRVKNPKAYTGLTQQEMAELYAADLTHLDALEGHLGIAAQVADFH